MSRQNEIIDLIKNYYANYTQKIESLMEIEEDRLLYDTANEMWIKFKSQLAQTKEVLKYLDEKASIE